jgi:hypothetical protein
MLPSSPQQTLLPTNSRILPQPLRPRSHPRPLLQQSPHPSPHQQPYSSRNEQKDNNLILPAIALETSREDILLLCAFAEGDSLSEAECAVAFVAGRAAVAGCAGFEKVRDWKVERRRGGRVRLGVGVGGAELDDGAVVEAGAFAEGWGC